MESDRIDHRKISITSPIYDFQEKDLEDILCRNFNKVFGDNWIFEGRQVYLKRYYKVDMLGHLKSNMKTKLIIELKKGIINNHAVFQILRYMGYYKALKNSVIAILVGKYINNSA